MRGAWRNKRINKHKAIRLISLVCVACFVAVFILFASLSFSHGEHAVESVSGCQRTLMPECNCENAVAARAPIHIKSHEHTDAHFDCLVCTFIQKTVSQLRQLTAMIVGAASVDAVSFLSAALCLCILFATIGTPVKLKTQLNN